MMKQQLSELIDGEGDISRSEHVFLAAKSNGEMARAWREYHLIGDVMRGDVWSSADMSHRVMAALEDEPTVLTPAASQPVKQRQWVNYTWSIAASLAAAFFVGLFVLGHQTAVMPVQIADQVADEYVMAHHNYAPDSSTYYVHNVAYSGD